MSEEMKGREPSAATTAAKIWTDKEIRGFFARQQREDHPCQYGHFGCSDRDGGVCMDELLGLIGKDHPAAPAFRKSARSEAQ